MEKLYSKRVGVAGLQRCPDWMPLARGAVGELTGSASSVIGVEEHIGPYQAGPKLETKIKIREVSVIDQVLAIWFSCHKSYCLAPWTGC